MESRKSPLFLRFRALGLPLAGALLLAVPLLGGCGGKSPIKTTGVSAALSPAPTDSGPANDPKVAPILTMPASRFAVSLDDLGTSFITNVPDTFVLNADNYGTSKTFAQGDDGKKLLSEWGYLGGYETSFRPEGGDKSILEAGAYDIAVEVHLFKDVAGAQKAYDYFAGRLKAGSAEPVSAPQLGNESSAWKLVSGKITNSTIDAAYNRFMFRRGNLVAVLLTYGADPFMTITQARDLAKIVDAKALGQKQAIEPTPTSNYQTPTPQPLQSPSPAATAGH